MTILTVVLMHDCYVNGKELEVFSHDLTKSFLLDDIINNVVDTLINSTRVGCIIKDDQFITKLLFDGIPYTKKPNTIVGQCIVASEFRRGLYAAIDAYNKPILDEEERFRQATKERLEESDYQTYLQLKERFKEREQNELQ